MSCCRLVSCLSLGALVVLGATLSAHGADAQNQGKPLGASDLPPAVAKILKERWPKATVQQAHEVAGKEGPNYVVELRMPRQGKNVTLDVTFDGNGKVLNWENPETKVALAQLPARVLATARQRFPGAELLKAEKENEDGKEVYEITLNHQGRRLEAEFSPEGDYLEQEVSVELHDLPATVTETLHAKYPNASYRHAAKVTKSDDSVSYEVVVRTADGKHGEVVISPDGKLVKGIESQSHAGQR